MFFEQPDRGGHRGEWQLDQMTHVREGLELSKINIIEENGFAKGDGTPQSSDDVFLLDDNDRRPVV